MLFINNKKQKTSTEQGIEDWKKSLYVNIPWTFDYSQDLPITTDVADPLSIQDIERAYRDLRQIRENDTASIGARLRGEFMNRI